MTTEPTPPTRRPFQFSLRTLLVVMLVVSLGMGWVMKERRRIAERRVAIELAGLRFCCFGEKRQPLWHLILFGDDSPAYSMVFNGDNRVTDAGLTCLKGMTQLKWLHLYDTQISDAGLVHLRGLTQLTMLDLENTHVSDAGLEHIKGLTQLELLRLPGTQVSRAGVANLRTALKHCSITR